MIVNTWKPTCFGLEETSAWSTDQWPWWQAYEVQLVAVLEYNFTNRFFQAILLDI